MQVLHISKDIASLNDGIDFHLSKIKSLRDRISNLLVEQARIMSTTVPREVPYFSTDDYQITDADLKNLGIEDPHGTNLAHPLPQPVINLVSSPDVQSSPPTIQGSFTTQDLICSETIGFLSPLPPGLTYVCGGTTVHLGLEKADEPMKKCRMLTERMQELSGIMGTWDRDSV